MDHRAFPPAARPQPLLPLSLQKQYEIPMSHNSLQFKSSSWLWQQLLGAANTVELSYAIQRDEQKMQPSSFVAGLHEMECLDVTNHQPSAELEDYADAIDLPLQADEKIHGGTMIIRNQSACPFRAFVTHRLLIAKLEDTKPELSPPPEARLSTLHLNLSGAS